MRCNDCKYCVRNIIMNDETLKVEFKCKKNGLNPINTFEMERYDTFDEPECINKMCNQLSESEYTDKIGMHNPEELKSDNVNHPVYYNWLKDKCGIEAIDIIRHFCYDIGNAMKYLIRAGRKSDADKTQKEKTIEDLKKAIWYIEDHIKCLENDTY